MENEHRTLNITLNIGGDDAPGHFQTEGGLHLALVLHHAAAPVAINGREEGSEKAPAVVEEGERNVAPNSGLVPVTMRRSLSRWTRVRNL